MKKNVFFAILAGALISMAGASFLSAAETEKVADKKTATTEVSQNSSSEKTSEGTSPAPIARVSSGIKEEAAKEKPAVTKESHEISSEKKASEPSVKPEVSSSLNSADMQRRWKELFSKEITSGTIAYTVKPGDSLYVIALKNHTTVDLIKQINGLKSDSIYPQMKLKVHTAPFSIKIDKSKNVLVLYSDGEAVKEYSVATGKKNCTPVGEFKITDKLVHPTWFKTGAILPPGSPENALGTRWMGFDKPGYGIHGTIEPKSIGTQASEGCIRMLNNEVEELYSLVPVGTKVTIQD